MTNIFDLSGRNAIVTGGGKGLGKGIAEGFLEAGANVIITGSSKAIWDTVEEFRDRGFHSVQAVPMNLKDRLQRGQAFDKCIDFFHGKLDILVNNAGIQKRLPLEKFTLEDWDEVLEVDLTAVFDLSQRAVKAMRVHRYGKIINISSIGAYISSAKNIPAYQAAKAGVGQLTVCFADECAKYGICTNSIAPGYAKTGLTRAVYENPEDNERTRLKVPLGRWGTPQDFKGAALLLASRAGDYINGASIVVDGGVLCV